ncbi:uncharacterized protein LOC141690146 [Apium graveolens]|uniref:uncharacterized protein LOC141690146 n=1 Tax=Apium graveolens TaxID=4045 RepID=UPI003D79FBB1
MANMVQPNIPKLTSTNYGNCIQMKVLLGSYDNWKIVENGFNEPADAAAEAALPNAEKTALKEILKKDKKALYIIIQGVDESTFEKISEAKTAKEAWKIFQKSFQGVKKVKKARLQVLRGEFKNLKMKNSENIGEFVTHLKTVTNKMKRNGESLDDVRVISGSSSSARGRDGFRGGYHGGRGRGSYECRAPKVEERSHFIAVKEDKDVGTAMFLTYKGDEESKKNIDETISGEVTFGDSSKIPFKGKGTITIVSKNGEKKTKVRKCLKSVIKNDSWLWHLRFGHLRFSGLKLLSKTKMVDGLPEINEPENLCEACVKGKQHRQSFPIGKSWGARRPLEIVHTDIAGPFDIPSLGGNKYYLTFIDDFSRKSWVYIIKEKSEALDKFKEFKALAEK